MTQKKVWQTSPVSQGLKNVWSNSYLTKFESYARFLV